MTFVAQPYEQFVDDLLTALTGGVIREEHLFTGSEATYTVASPDVEPATVRVFGQRNDAFTVFDRGVDYDLVTAGDGEMIAWKAKGRLPDDRSYFYANYYTREAVPRLTDRNPGSVTTTLAEAFARELAVLHTQMEGIYRSAFVDLATGGALDHVVALLGLTRRDAKFATGEVVVKRSTPAPGDVAIPAGTLFSTDQGQNFETTDKRTLRKGQLAVTVSVRAQVEGAPGKVDAGAIKNINRPIFGIETVVNEAATFFGAPKETDEELRRRLQATIGRAGKSTLDAIKYALIEEVAEITEANIQLAERPEQAGIVEVRLGLPAAGDADLVRRIEAAIFYARPAGVRVTHNLPTRTAAVAASGITREEAAADFADQNEPVAAYRLAPDVLAAMPDGLLPLRVEVFLRLAQANLSAVQKAGIEDGVRQTIRDYVAALPMGATFVYHKLVGRIVAPDEIVDAAILVGVDAAGRFVSFKGNLAADGRKAAVDDARIFVGLMDEAVNVDVTVTVVAQAGTQADPTALREAAKEGGALYLKVRDAVTAQLEAAKSALARGALEAAIRPLLEGTAPLLQFADPSAVVLSAEHVETGRLLTDTDQVTFEANEVPVLRRLSLRVKSELDG